MVSHPELGSDPPIGSDQESGRDIPSIDMEGPLSQMRVVTILRTLNLINLYNPNNNFIIYIIIF